MSTETKHTPGPWIARPLENNPARIYVVQAGQGEVPLIAIAEGNPQAEANARLIAAAPALLEAAKELVADASVTKEPFPSAIVRRSRIANLQAAIAKAEGRAQ